MVVGSVVSRGNFGFVLVGVQASWWMGCHWLWKGSIPLPIADRLYWKAPWNRMLRSKPLYPSLMGRPTVVLGMFGRPIACSSFWSMTPSPLRSLYFMSPATGGAAVLGLATLPPVMSSWV